MSGVFRAVARRLLLAWAFGYGLFTMGLFGLLAVWHGYFFSRPSEKQTLELQLGRSPGVSQVPPRLQPQARSLHYYFIYQPVIVCGISRASSPVLLTNS